MAFFKEFPHSRYYDTDLAWLIKRMKEIMQRLNELDEALRRMEELKNEILELMTRLESIVTEIAERVIREEIGKYLPQNARPIAGYANVLDTNSKHTYGQWSVVSNFSGGSTIATSGTAYICAYETFDRILLLLEVPYTSGATSEGTATIKLSADKMNSLFDAIGPIDFNEPRIKTMNLNPLDYLGLRPVPDSQNEGRFVNISMPKRVGQSGAGQNIMVLNLKKAVEGWRG